MNTSKINTRDPPISGQNILSQCGQYYTCVFLHDDIHVGTIQSFLGVLICVSISWS